MDEKVEKEENKEMNIKIMNASADGLTNNKGSCAALAEYINHEDEERLAEGKEILPYTTPEGIEVTTEEVISKIDRNHRGLGKKDDKYFGFIVSPSPPEIEAMGETEAEIYTNGLKLIKAISDSYSQNFNREGIEDSSDLIMFWKPHFSRGNNDELQFHFHGIVARKSKGVNGKSQKLSPLTNHRDTKDGPITGGFDRKTFFVKCEKLFDKLFKYERSVAETFEYNNAQAHGTPEEKAKQAELLAAEKTPGMLERIAAGIERRRGAVKVKNDIEELSAMLEAEHFEFPKSSESALNEAVELASVRNQIAQAFTQSHNFSELEMNLLTVGITCKELRGPENGVDDLVFSHGGREIRAKNIFEPTNHREMLYSWKEFTGQKLSFELQAEAKAAADKAQKHFEDISQKKRGMKIGRK